MSRNLLAVPFLLTTLLPTTASATADFFYISRTPEGGVEIGANVSTSGQGLKLLLPPIGNPSVTIQDREVDMANSAQYAEKEWNVLRDQRTHQLIIAFRRINTTPVFVTGVVYPFCDSENWKESC